MGANEATLDIGVWGWGVVCSTTRSENDRAQSQMEARLVLGLGSVKHAAQDPSSCGCEDLVRQSTILLGLVYRDNLSV